VSLYAENLNYGIPIKDDVVELERGCSAWLTKDAPFKDRSHILHSAPEGPTFNNYEWWR
jgi:hypothetical protein